MVAKSTAVAFAPEAVAAGLVPRGATTEVPTANAPSGPVLHDVSDEQVMGAAAVLMPSAASTCTSLSCELLFLRMHRWLMRASAVISASRRSCDLYLSSRPCRLAYAHAVSSLVRFIAPIYE